RTDYDTAWTLSIIRGFIVAVLVLAIAEPAADLFDEPRLALVVGALALTPLLHGFQNIGVVDFRKSLDFRRDFLFMASAKVVAVVVAIGLAIVWRNYWALVGGMIGAKLWRIGASYAMHAYRPRFTLERWRELFAFTKWLLLHNILSFFRNRADRLVIGKMLGAVTLGVYTLAYDLANLATTELMAPIRRALLPGYAKLVAEPERLRAMFIDVFGLTMWIGAPIAIGIGLVAEPTVGLLLGDDWAAAVPITQMLVIAGFVALLSSGSHPVYLALGRPEIQTLLAAFAVVLLLPAMIIGVEVKGVIGASIAVVLVQTLVAWVDIALVLHFLNLDVKAIAAACWRSLVALALMAVSVHAIVRAWPVDRSAPDDALLLASAIAAGAAVYLLSSFCLWRMFGAPPGPERHLWQAAVRGSMAVRPRVS
ncbi:MAG: oligosaccharide flippase family protein, partial [Alphaproteobacteria bacterium]|nr:oligosaccharide flippase family protein [Alphaproteobacteria bacterium]